MEVCRSCCREVKKGYQRTNSPRYYISTIPQGDEDGEQSEIEEPRVVVQMDTESPAIYQKSCLDHYFDKPIQVSYKFLSNIIQYFSNKPLISFLNYHFLFYLISELQKRNK